MIPGKLAQELQLIALSEFSLWAIVLPERFGLPPIPDGAMIGAAARAHSELRKIFHEKPLKPWCARLAKSNPKIFQFAQRNRKEQEPTF